MDRTSRQLLEGKHEAPVVNAATVTRSEFISTAPLGQSYAGHAAWQGETPEVRSLDYRTEREPEPKEIREAAIFWINLAETLLKSSDIINSEQEHLRRSDIPAFQGQKAMGNVLAVTKGPVGKGFSPSGFTGGLAMGDFSLESTEADCQAMNLHLDPVVGALIAEELARSAATREDMEQCKRRRKIERRPERILQDQRFSY